MIALWICIFKSETIIIVEIFLKSKTRIEIHYDPNFVNRVQNKSSTKKSLKIVKTCHSYLIYYIYELDIWKDKCTENGLRFKNKLRVAPNKKRFEIK